MNQNKLNEVHLMGFLVNILNHLGWKGETEIHTIMSKPDAERQIIFDLTCMWDV